jgi:DNA-binding transcriptional regulator YdaS (Cro superfamily)
MVMSCNKLVMNLADYLEKTGTDRKEFAAALGVKLTTVYRWLRGDRVPIRHFHKIAEATGGKVTANDFVRTDA